VTIVKVLAFILSVLIGTALVAGGTFLIVTQSPHHSFGLDLLAIFALTVLIYGPLLLGSLTSYWNVRGSEASRSYFRRVLWVALGLDVLAVVAIVVFGITVRAPLWFPVVFIAGGAALMLVALAVGRALIRHEQAHPRPEAPWRPVGRQEIQRKVLIMTVTFVVVFAVALIAFGALLSNDGDAASNIGSRISFALQSACLATAMAGIIVTVPLNRRLRTTVGGDLGTIRKVAKVVLGDKKLDLDHSEQVAAAKYATIIPTVLAFLLSYTALLYISIGIQQVRLLLDGRNEPFSIGFTVLLIVVLIFFIPYYTVRIRRARRYARDHSALLSLNEEPAGA
jgi:hypothetical protein